MKMFSSKPLQAAPASQYEFAEDPTSSAARSGNAFWKRSFDLSMVIVALILLLPLLAAGVLALRILQGRPVFIRHKRIGQHGKSFYCLKFRTMVTDAQDVLQRHLETNESARKEWAENFKLRDDPRVTPLGSVLRKSSLDELPQLWNIFRGEMSIVGPRPIVVDEVRRYGANIDDYHKVKPGLTGLWQVSGRSDIDYATRVRMDVEYVKSISVLRDLKIIALTVPALVTSRGSY